MPLMSLLFIKALAASIALDDNERQRLNDLIGRKALLAGEAFAAAADGRALFGRAGINDLALGKAAKRAFHMSLPPYIWFPITLHNSVQYYTTAPAHLHEKFRRIWRFLPQIQRIFSYLYRFWNASRVMSALSTSSSAFVLRCSGRSSCVSNRCRAARLSCPPVSPAA